MSELETKVTKSESTTYSVVNRHAGSGTHSQGKFIVSYGPESVHIMCDSCYGQYTHYWSHCGMEPRKFLAKTNMNYALRKLCSGSHMEIDIDACKKEAKSMVNESFNDGELIDTQRDDMIQELDEIYSDYGGSRDMISREIGAMECFDIVFGEYEYIPSLDRVSPCHEQFWKHIWTPFIEQLKKELWLKKEIRLSIENYKSDGNITVESAMLSGMSLVASFLAKKDGSKDFRAADMLVAITEYAAELKMAPEKNRKKENEF